MSRKPGFVRRTFSAAGKAFANAALFVAPQTVGRRIAWRNALEFQKASMLAGREALDRDRFRGAKWLTSRLSPDSELEEGLADAQDRSRDLYLNDPVAAGYVKGRVTNVTGTGMMPQARIRASREWEPLKIDEARARKLNQQLEDQWERWQAKASRDGRESFWMIQRLAERCCARDGECLVVLSDVPLPGKPVPLAIEVVSITRLETPPEKSGDPRVRLGIETDEAGTPVAYWIRNTDPNDTVETDQTYDRVPVDRVCHVYEKEEGGQHRGWPASVPSMTSLKDVKDHDEAVLIQRQAAACLAILIEQGPGGNPTADALAAATGVNSNSQRLEEIVPGMIRYLNNGQKPHMLQPGMSSGADHGEYLDSKYHRISAGLNYPFELLTKAYGGTNYSSGRLSLLDGRAEFRAGQKFQIDLLNSRVWERFVLECVTLGIVQISAAEYLGNEWVFTRHIWIPPGWPWVDPVKEVLADSEAVDNGFTSRGIVNQGRGLVDDEVQENRLREKMLDADNEKRLRDYREKLGLSPDEPGSHQSSDSARSAASQPDDSDGNGDGSKPGTNKANSQARRHLIRRLAVSIASANED